MSKKPSQETFVPLHPLEGKYLVFNHVESNYEDEGALLVIYQLIRGKLKAVLHPSVDPEWRNVKHIPDLEDKNKNLTPSEHVIQKLKQKGITEVVSVIRNDVFFGIPFGFQDISEPDHETEEIENWYEYHDICIDSEEYILLKEAGINVKFFLQGQNKFIK